MYHCKSAYVIILQLIFLLISLYWGVILHFVSVFESFGLMFSNLYLCLLVAWDDVMHLECSSSSSEQVRDIMLIRLFRCLQTQNGGSKGVWFRQWALTVSLNLIKDKEFTRFMVDYSINLMFVYFFLLYLDYGHCRENSGCPEKTTKIVLCFPVRHTLRTNFTSYTCA